MHWDTTLYISLGHYIVHCTVTLSTVPILTDCEYGLGTPLSPEEKSLLHDCANPNKEPLMFLANLVSLVCCLSYDPSSSEIINRIMIMSDNVKVLIIFTQKELLN